MALTVYAPNITMMILPTSYVQPVTIHVVPARMVPVVTPAMPLNPEK